MKAMTSHRTPKSFFLGRSVEMLDTSIPNAKWKTVTEMPGVSRGWSGAESTGGKIYLIGGSHFFDPKPSEGPDRKRLEELWQLDPNSLRWERRAALPYHVAGFDCCVYRDRYIILVGGAASLEDFSDEMRKQQQQDRFHASYYSPFVLVYDTVTDRWQRMPSLMPVAANDIRVVLVGETLYALGGENIEPATSNTTPWLRIGRIQIEK